MPDACDVYVTVPFEATVGVFRTAVATTCTFCAGSFTLHTEGGDLLDDDTVHLSEIACDAIEVTPHRRFTAPQVLLERYGTTPQQFQHQFECHLKTMSQHPTEEVRDELELLMATGDITNMLTHAIQSGLDATKMAVLHIPRDTDLDTNPLCTALSSSNAYPILSHLLEMGVGTVNRREGTNDASPLCYAVKAGSVEAVDLLIEFGAEVVEGGGGDSPLMVACGTKGVVMVKRLLEKVAEGDVVKVLSLSGRHGYTALHRAVLCGNTAAASLLLSKGAPVDAADVFGDTPLIVAAKQNSIPTARLLLLYGASVAVANNKGRTPSVYAKDHNNAALQAILSEGLKKCEL